MATNLFEKVQELQLKREKDNQSMMDFMASLDGYGQIGYGLGTGLARLFSGDKKDSEMLQAEREDAYAKRVLMEQDPAMQQNLLQGAFALSSELGQNLQTQLAEERSAEITALKNRMEMQKMQQDMEIARGEETRKRLEQARKIQNPFEMPDDDDITATQGVIDSINWEDMGYKQAPNQLQVVRMAGLMKGQMDPTQAWLTVMGQPPSDVPINDKYADVRAKTDKQMPPSDVTNPKSLSDPTEY